MSPIVEQFILSGSSDGILTRAVSCLEVIMLELAYKRTIAKEPALEAP